MQYRGVPHLLFNDDGSRVSRDGYELVLGPSAWAILYFLNKRKGVCSLQEIAHYVYSRPAKPAERGNIRVLICKLRRQIKSLHIEIPVSPRNKAGAGYQLRSTT